MGGGAFHRLHDLFPNRALQGCASPSLRRRRQILQLLPVIEEGGTFFIVVSSLSHECVRLDQTKRLQFLMQRDRRRERKSLPAVPLYGRFPAGEAAHRRQEKKTAVLFRQIRDRFRYSRIASSLGKIAYRQLCVFRGFWPRCRQRSRMPRLHRAMD